jgi:glutathione S-transferase
MFAIHGWRRLFDAKDESEVRVNFYRDHAAWCPYCQKTWLLLEEKRIPYKVTKINMRSYGDKPASFTNKVPGGFLPALELDGKMMTESLVVMQVLDSTFQQGPAMVPPAGTPERDRAQVLLQLERELFSAWCSLTFQPGKGIFDSNERKFVDTLRKVDDALLATPGPWFLGGDAPSLVDLQYISHVERMVASVLYWKNLKLRGTGTYPGLDAWFAAFEARPSYLATKSDYYTHVMDIPPQYGPGWSIDSAKDVAAAIRGQATWQLPLKLGTAEAVEPLAPLQYSSDEAACHEAAYKLTLNARDVVPFAARAVGTPGGWVGPGKAELADPYAQPADALIEPVDVALRHVATALLDGTDAALAAGAAEDLKAADADLPKCLGYLRDRVGVPRDMGQAAAVSLRAHLQWAIDLCS